MPRCFTKWGKKGNSQSGSLAKVYLVKQGDIKKEKGAPSPYPTPKVGAKAQNGSPCSGIFTTSRQSWGLGYTRESNKFKHRNNGFRMAL
jgi:hypothetical protein